MNKRTMGFSVGNRKKLLRVGMLKSIFAASIAQRAIGMLSARPFPQQ